jgi:hypothetical protein
MGRIVVLTEGYEQTMTAHLAPGKWIYHEEKGGPEVFGCRQFLV